MRPWGEKETSPLEMLTELGVKLSREQVMRENETYPNG